MVHQKWRARVLILIGLAVGLGLLFGLQWVLNHPATNPRAGFGISTLADANIWADRLGASWYLDWRTGSPPDAPLEYWQMVRIRQGEGVPPLSQCAELAQRWPGAVWVIGNEPDNIWQDNLVAEDYARLYHAYYEAIKAADPSAQVAIGAVSQATPLRLAYLERVLAAYQKAYGRDLPVDWWTVHGYVLREERGSWGADIPPGFDDQQGLLIDPDQHGDMQRFQDGVIAFRAWMAVHGYRDTPLALTEFGILLPEDFGYSPTVVAQYLTDSFTWLDTAIDPTTGCACDDGRLVQRWTWFSLSDPNFPVADLADLEAGRLTPLGEAFRAFTKANAAR